MPKHNAPQSPPLQPAQLRWAGDTPEAENYGDIYFSRDNGLEESRHVFLDGNKLHERFTALKAAEHFVIAETGFGTGLNFLLSWQLWQETAPANAQLFFISTELHPLTREDMARALSCWPELAPFAEQLLHQYPALIPGFHWLRFNTARITLLLLLGDANDTLPQLTDSAHADFDHQNPWAIDAWFLDGFAPSKNPQLWQQDLLSHIARLSKNGTTLATFTAAGQVRRDLAAHGFSVQKIPGYGSKREMSVAQFHEHSADAHTKHLCSTTPWLLKNTAHPAPDEAIVIGTGLAGSHIARALAERGVRVTVLEQHAQPAQEGSGNPQGALYTKLSANSSALSQFSLASFQYALRHYHHEALHEVFHACGLLQLNDDSNAQLAALLQHNPELAQYLDADSASTRSGITLTRSGWWLPQAGWANPARICSALLDHPLISVHYNTPIDSLTKTASGWQLHDAEKNIIGSSAQVIVACANHSARFAQTAWLPLRPVRGQISTLPATANSAQLQCVICDEGYLTPAHNNEHCLGASFVPGDTDTDLRAAEHTHNLNLLQDISPALRQEWQQVDGGRAAVRATTPDHLPLVGALPERESFLLDYAALRHNAKAVINTSGSYVEGLWLLAGFGGRGLCYIPLAAELLASQLLNQPRPLSRALQQALAPARFVIRELMRQNSNP